MRRVFAEFRRGEDVEKINAEVHRAESTLNIVCSNRAAGNSPKALFLLRHPSGIYITHTFYKRRITSYA